jgi:hypothetical protein
VTLDIKSLALTAHWLLRPQLVLSLDQTMMRVLLPTKRVKHELFAMAHKGI